MYESHVLVSNARNLAFYGPVGKRVERGLALMLQVVPVNGLEDTDVSGLDKVIIVNEGPSLCRFHVGSHKGNGFTRLLGYRSSVIQHNLRLFSRSQLNVTVCKLSLKYLLSRLTLRFA